MNVLFQNIFYFYIFKSEITCLDRMLILLITQITGQFEYIFQNLLTHLNGGKSKMVTKTNNHCLEHYFSQFFTNSLSVHLLKEF